LTGIKKILAGDPLLPIAAACGEGISDDACLRSLCVASTR